MRTVHMFLALGFIACASLACGTVKGQNDGGPAATDDAGESREDAAPQSTPAKVQEIGSGGTRVRGATYEVEVQIGHPVSQNKVSGETFDVEGAAPVKP